MRKLNTLTNVKASPAKAVAKAAKASTVAPVAPVNTKAAKPATPKADTVRAERVAVFADLRTQAARFYAGASSVIHKAKPGKRDEYSARVTSPVQQCSGGTRTERDTALNVVLHLESDSKNRSFDPCKLGVDLGALSRLASVQAVAFSGDTFSVTEAGASYARNALANEAKRVTKA